MKPVLLTVGTLVAALIGMVLVVGWMAPVAHVAVRRARFGKPPPAIFAAITDVDALPSWRRGLESVERLPERDGKTCYRELTDDGPLVFLVDESLPYHRLVTRLADPDLPFGGTWTFEIEPAKDGSLLTITERGEIYSVVYRALALLYFGHTRNMDRYLDSLAVKFGESITIESVDPNP